MKSAYLYIAMMLWGSISLMGQKNQLTYDYKQGYLIVEVPTSDSLLVQQWENLTGIQKSTIDSLKSFGNEKSFDLSGWKIFSKKEKLYSKKKLKKLDFDQLHQFNICDDIPLEKSKVSDRFGINYFKISNPFPYDGTSYTFFLPGYQDANEVFLAGSFNQWSTIQDAMTKTPDGWKIELPLSPNKYEYKYIIDGEWSVDQNNLRMEDDGYGNINSVIYLPNVTFVLEKKQEAAQVHVRGSFNDWKLPGIPMTKRGSKWLLEMWFPRGVVEYQFVVDGEVTADPADQNPSIGPEGSGYSKKIIGDVRHFTTTAFPDAKKVILTGTFTDWSTERISMSRSSDAWEADLPIDAGVYEYKYIVDGEWRSDEDNPHRTGHPPYVNSIMVINPNHVFRLKGYENAKEVFVSGTFNGWSEEGYLMQKTTKGWEMKLHLPTGKTRYKFLIDGRWLHDPENPLWETNQYDTKDSILWID